MKVLVQYSGGKDSQASLIWAVKKFGAKNIEAVFCDTGWEHSVTYQHVQLTTNELGVELVVVRSSTYSSLIDLARKKGRFPSVMARFCTSELKVKPFVDYVLSQNQDLLIIQGIRALESDKRSTMSRQCTYFKYYHEPYNDRGKTHTYRKKEVLDWSKKYSNDIIRPFFNSTGQNVVDYILDNGQVPNPLYKRGAKRVGCYPCIMSGQREVYEIIKRDPDRIVEIIGYENEIGSSFFKIDFVPERFQSGFDARSGKKFTKGVDVKKYLTEKNLHPSLFEADSIISCSSYYHLCE